MVKVRLVDAVTEEWIGEENYPTSPQPGNQIMFMTRDWHVYEVETVRVWPVREYTPDDELNGREPDVGLVEARVRYKGWLG